MHFIRRVLKPFIRGMLKPFGYDLVKRATATRIVFQGRVVVVNHKGASYRMFVENPKDRIQRHHFRGQLYEAEELEMIRSHFPAGGIFLDIGANVGNHSLFAVKSLGARQVVAYEPTSLQHSILSINVALNELSDRITVHRLALSNRSGFGHITTALIDNIGGARLSSESSGELVHLVKGDEMLGDVPIDFVKIDVEGHEIEVLEGLSTVISKRRPVLFVEVDEENQTAFETWMRNAGYQIIDRYKRYPTNENFLCKPI